jgi:hypothetical protein
MTRCQAWTGTAAGTISGRAERAFASAVDLIDLQVNRGGVPVSRNKHPKSKPGQRPRSDLDVNPGIGASKGSYMSGEDPRNLEGGSTFEGDVANETTREGGVDPNRIGRTNK